MTLKNRGLVRTVQIILGLALIIFGLNAFMQFMPAPEFTGPAGEFLGALFNSGYVIPLMAVIWLVSGILLIINRAAPFAAAVIAPITLNIVAFHIFIDASNSLFAWVFFILNAYLIYVYWPAYRPMFK